MTAIILAGGKAKRMSGRDKAFLKIGSDTLISLQLKKLKKIFKKIIIVTNSPQKHKRLKGVKIISDAIPNRGPLGGIYSGLEASGAFYNFVVACDMPFINLNLIKYMVSLKDGFDVVVCRLKNGYESLFAIYSKNCLGQIKKIINTDNLSVRQLFRKVKLKELKFQQIRRFGDPKTLFMNINTFKELSKVQDIW